MRLFIAGDWNSLIADNVLTMKELRPPTELHAFEGRRVLAASVQLLEHSVTSLNRTVYYL
jgi:hypothetical protein